MKSEKSVSLSNDSQALRQVLQTVYEEFEVGNFTLAEKNAEKALGIVYDDPEVLCALKCAVFWKEREDKLIQLDSSEYKADYLVKEYSGFTNRFLQRLDYVSPEAVFAIKQFVFTTAAQTYLEKASENPNSEFLTKAAGAYKRSGNYEKAISLLEGVVKDHKGNSQALAELGDCYEKVNDIKQAKLLYREAFFVDPQGIELEKLESLLLTNLVDDLKKEGYSLPILKEWIPIYAVIKGIFTIRRDLKPLEVGQLKQSIYALKNEIQESTVQQSILLPRLINKYFWLIDHYLCIREERSKIEEVLLNIKLLDERIFTLYTH